MAQDSSHREQQQQAQTHHNQHERETKSDESVNSRCIAAIMNSGSSMNMGRAAGRNKSEGENLSEYADRSSLFFAMYHRQWDQVSRMLFKRKGRVPKLSLEELEASVNSELNEKVGVLHVLCRFQPPAELLERILKLYGDDLARQRDDETGQYPLHVACQHGCLSAVVTKLLDSFPEAAMAQDLNGRVPLHLACRPFRWCPPVEHLDIDEGEDEPEIQYIQAGSAVIYVLCQHTPEASNVNDLDDRNALEIAIEEDVATKNICKILMDASDKAWKQMVSLKKQRYSSNSDISWKSSSDDGCSDSQLNGFPAYYTGSAARERLRLSRIEDTTLARGRPLLSRGPTSFNELSCCLPPYEDMLEQYRVRSPSQRSFLSLPSTSAGYAQEVKASKAKNMLMHLMPSQHSQVPGTHQKDSRQSRRRKEQGPSSTEISHYPANAKNRPRSDSGSSFVNAPITELALDSASELSSQVSSRNTSFASISSSHATVDVTRTDILSHVQQQIQFQQTKGNEEEDSGGGDRTRGAKSKKNDSHYRGESERGRERGRKKCEKKGIGAQGGGAISVTTYAPLDKTANDDSTEMSYGDGSAANGGVGRMIASLRGKASIKSRRLRIGRAA